ncbi:MAG TPA: LysR substrate-binding domain-containing protein [Myxococcales bacterium]|jgi:DNA-binding transcriptional LysR family regulator|nr:LysR substrate-binding domain-containing protein [Myxococcales bacterium]
MLKLDSLAAFVSVFEGGSVNEGARRLGVSSSAVSERLSELERAVGVALLHRTTRAVSVTEEGKAFYERARRILQDLVEAEAEIAHRRGELQGPLRIAAPVSFGVLHLGPALCGFLGKHPKIDLTLDVEDKLVSLTGGGYDALIRHGPVLDEHVILKRLAQSRRFLVASPAYLKSSGTPKSVDELGQHRGIVYSIRGGADWRFKARRKVVTVRPERVVLRVNNGLLMRDAAVAGLGIALLPGYFIQAEVMRKKLVVIDVGAEPEGATLYIAYPYDRRGSAKVRALTQWLRNAFGAPAYWENLTP